MADTYTVKFETKASNRDDAREQIMADARNQGHDVLGLDGPYEDEASGMWSSEVLAAGKAPANKPATRRAPTKKKPPTPVEKKKQTEAKRKRAVKKAKADPDGKKAADVEKKRTWLDKLTGKKKEE